MESVSSKQIKALQAEMRELWRSIREVKEMQAAVHLYWQGYTASLGITTGFMRELEGDDPQAPEAGPETPYDQADTEGEAVDRRRGRRRRHAGGAVDTTNATKGGKRRAKSGR